MTGVEADGDVLELVRPPADDVVDGRERAVGLRLDRERDPCAAQLVADAHDVRVQPRAIVVDPRRVGERAGGDRPRLRSAIPREELAHPATAAVADELVDALAAVVRPADDLVIVFTSGSRGAPKGVIHTHGGALGATQAGLAIRGLDADDRLYIPMPFFWVGGLGTGLLSVLVAGATLVTERQPEASATLELLERERVTLFRGWPDQAVAIAAHPDFASTDLSRLKSASLPRCSRPSDAVSPAAGRDSSA